MNNFINTKLIDFFIFIYYTQCMNTEIIEKINKCIEAFIASDDYQTLCDEYDLLPLE